MRKGSKNQRFLAQVQYHSDGLVVRPVPRGTMKPIKHKGRERDPHWGYYAWNPFYECYVVWREDVDTIKGIEDINDTRRHRNARWAGRGVVELEVEMDLSAFDFPENADEENLLTPGLAELRARRDRD